MQEMLFVTRDHFGYRIAGDEAWTSIFIISLVTILVLFSLTRDKGRSWEREFFSFDTSLTLKGLSVIFLLFGHLAYSRIDGIQAFEEGGYWAVIMFLVISGVGLTKTYGMENCDKTFLIRRVKRIVTPTWITLIVFYLLDFLLLNRAHSLSKIVANLSGVLTPGPPNGPAWYISYILFCYLIMLGVAQLGIGVFKRGVLLLVVFYLATSVILSCSKLENYFGVWTIYSIVFPSSVLLGLYHGGVSRVLNSVDRYSREMLVVFAVVCAGLFYENIGIGSLMRCDFLSGALKKYVYTLRPLYLILALTFTAHMVDKMRRASKVLEFLGEYSMEIFLLHYPFMVYYDFLLFRKPLWFFFLIYVVLILGLSLMLRKGIVLMNRMVFGKCERLLGGTEERRLRHAIRIMD